MDDLASEWGRCGEPAAEDLSERHRPSSRPPAAVEVWSRLARVEEWLEAAHRLCLDPPDAASKAAEWLLDNAHEVQQALRQIRVDMPRGFYQRLPSLASADGAGLPRSFVLAHEYLRCSKLQVSLHGTVHFVNAYQERAPLTIAELWAFPTMLRLACAEILIASLTPLLGEPLALPVTLSAGAGETFTLEENERAARAIANLRQIAVIRWEDFFDQTSRVEETLRSEPSGFYARMDFESRDRYRRAVEEIAGWAGLGELEIAAKAVARAQAAGSEQAASHVGYWLADRGRRLLEQGLGAQVPLRERLKRVVLDHPGPSFGLALTACGLAALLVPGLYLVSLGARADALDWVLSLLLVAIPASVLAVATLNWIITRALPPRTLLKLDFRRGIPADCRTMIVVPAVVARPEEAGGLAEQIETHWLSSADPNVQVALLADLADADQFRLSSDETVEKALKERIEALNERYGTQGRGPFHLMMRPRLYNRAQGCWMAWERKRGKLEQLNRWLLEDDRSAFSVYTGDSPALRDVRFIVTVDADTLLPPGTVARLAGALAHPLNRATLDPSTGRVTSGCSIIQPRVEISPQSGRRTLFARLFTGDTAIDIYSRAVSDVYQDLFGSGTFVGKGIYEVRAFHRSLDGRVPENSILSHDLFEGAHARAALASDVVLYEGFPETYLEFGRRLHRWIRGDWQLLGWLRRQVRLADGRHGRNAIAGIDRWKLLDNLRRSLVAPGLVLLALGGWFLLPGSPLFWTLLVLLAPGGQLFAELVSGLARGRRRGVAAGVLPNLLSQSGRWFLALAFLLHEALLSVHAVTITCWRLIARRGLLEWTSAAHVAARLRNQSGRPGIWRQMWLGPSLSAAAAAALVPLRPAALPVAIPLLLLWFAAPEIAFRIGRRRREPIARPDPASVPFLRRLARRTWFYFETFAGPEHNWLPPDNYQEEPHAEVAGRTSPTNIGMLLLSTAAAFELGFIGRSELAARVRNIFESLDRLQRHRGHFFNWYDTRTLEPLEPRYVSTVDSGNLAMCLLALAATLRFAAADRSASARRWLALADAGDLLETALSRVPEAGTLRTVAAGLQRRLAQVATEDDRASALRDALAADLPALEQGIGSAMSTAGAASSEALREALDWFERLSYQIRSLQRDDAAPDDEADDLDLLAEEAAAMAEETDFRPLYDPERRLFHIGHNASTGRTDPHHYDLLASEARLASFFAIAKGDVPPEHWFHLQRPVARAEGGLALLSWNGSMFEYLMPRLLLRPDTDTLLGESDRAAVATQRAYGRRHGVPWGISESGYSARDPDHRYRYQAFGVPALGLRRGLARDMVVAPYASALALPLAPREAADNLEKLSVLGAAGRFGLREAIDFTEERVGAGRSAPVRSYMAHHQGMILAGVANVLLDDLFVERLAREPRLRMISLLLNERIPRQAPPVQRLPEGDPRPRKTRVPPAPSPYAPAAAAPFVQMHLLGNGRLSSWISSAGGGGLHWHHNAVTRFTADPSRDADGLWIYIADDESGALWSATRQPTAAPPEDYRVLFHPHLAEFHRRDAEIHSRLEVVVAAGPDLEIRRLVLVNESSRTRHLRVTSYGEVVLSPALDDERHPAFSKLFVGAEHLPDLNGLLFTRRPRAPAETPPALVHFLVAGEAGGLAVGFDSDRASFIGRLRSVREPLAPRQDLSNSAGLTLDPVMALQARLQMMPYERRELWFVTAVAASPEAAIEAAQRHSTPAALEWATDDAAADAARSLARMRLAPEWWEAAEKLGSLLVYPAPLRATRAEALRTNRLGQADLWGLGLSGDLPILLVRNRSGREDSLPALLAAHQLWRRHALECDLVILQTGGSGYAEPLRDRLAIQLGELGLASLLGRRGGIHLLFADQIGADQARLLEVSARFVVDEDDGGIEAALAHALETPVELPQFSPVRAAAYPEGTAGRARERLEFDNGFGGFAAEGREYAIRLDAGVTTPAPWCNVLANDAFGCIVSEAGLGFSWALNSGENRLTPWTNDPVTDRAVEALYLRDEETGARWTVSPAPMGRAQTCNVRHGSGFTRWTKQSHGLDQEMTAFTAPSAPVKLVRLRLTNQLEQPRRVTATYYAEWLLGALPSRGRDHILCDYDEQSGAVFARSHWSPDFAGRVAFVGASERVHSYTSSRTEFLGREGDPADPAGLRRWGLAGEDGAGGDPCAAYQIHIDLLPAATAEFVFVLGQGADEQEARALVAAWASVEAANRALAALDEEWDNVLGAITVRSPDRSFDIMANRWLLYQARSSRIMARAGFHQAGGAVGFRDQLQDVLALLHVEPARARAQILLCAAHQFEEGDVLHWWHPPGDRGVRTRFSDDLLWLPFAAATYVDATGDLSIMDEQVPFLTAPELAPAEEDRYASFSAGAAMWPLHEHCHRALERAFRLGRHGLPLMGSGDWNDGMNRVGRAGRGESVWLAWFMVVTAEQMAALDRRLGREALAEHWSRRAAELRRHAEEAGWDGEWYRRAYDDEGHALGAARNTECRIDSISQSWALFAAADATRTSQALAAAVRELLVPEERLVRLLWPPFADGLAEPGYIKAYPPGIRENGGQYSHAAAWLGIALARAGMRPAAKAVFDALNPILHARDAAAAQRYRCEPYVVAADIGTVLPHSGRGGWTWYTGSAAWTWRFAVEWLLGLRRIGGKLLIDPHLPPGWTSYEASLRGDSGSIALRVLDPEGVGAGRVRISIDGEPFEGELVAFPDDGSVRRVEARLDP